MSCSRMTAKNATQRRGRQEDFGAGNLFRFSTRPLTSPKSLTASRSQGKRIEIRAPCGTAAAFARGLLNCACFLRRSRPDNGDVCTKAGLAGPHQRRAFRHTQIGEFEYRIVLARIDFKRSGRKGRRHMKGFQRVECATNHFDARWKIHAGRARTLCRSKPCPARKTRDFGGNLTTSTSRAPVQHSSMTPPGGTAASPSSMLWDPPRLVPAAVRTRNGSCHESNHKIHRRPSAMSYWSVIRFWPSLSSGMRSTLFSLASVSSFARAALAGMDRIFGPVTCLKANAV